MWFSRSHVRADIDLTLLKRALYFGRGFDSLSVRMSYRKISWKPRDSGLDFSNRSEIDRHLGIHAAEMPAKLWSDTIIITSKLTASRDLAVRRLIVY